jgi:hypothetical protein
MLQYTNVPPDTIIPCIRGLNIVRGKRTKTERALLGADLHLGRVQVLQPTVPQCSALLNVCSRLITSALAIIDDKHAVEAVLAGRMSLLTAERGRESLTDHFVRSSKEERAEMARTVGVGEIWDQLVLPLLD